ncbi:MAG: discoidin domain-containing protein [Kiritimatiellae bacterium]|nr:discoidin domain-containing protein [Kiritimatiellia bacterium]
MNISRARTRLACLMLTAAFSASAIQAANNPNVYLAMGDGITKGSPPTIGDPWPPRLDRLLGSGKTVINEGKSGSRVGYGSYKVSSYLSQYQPGYLLILYGTNDIGIGNDINYIIGELRDMIRAAKGRYTVPIVGTLPPVFNGYGSGLNTLNSRIRDLARSEGIICADVSSAFNNKRSLIMSDGLHPTPEGQQLIAKTFYNAIKVAPRPVTPPSLSISPTSASFSKAAAAGSINVTANSSSLAWSSSTASSWIHITGGHSGTGSGRVNYTVDENTGRDARTGTITVSGKTCTITQRGTYDNLALASRGSTITGSNGARWNLLIDGVTTGYDKRGNGYGYTLWTGDPAAPGQMTLDLHQVGRVDRIRLLLWNLDARYYRYFIEASVDGVNWDLIVDRTAGAWQGWQDIRFGTDIVARYFRLTGTYNSMNGGFHVVEWEAYGVPPPATPGLSLSPTQRAHGLGCETGVVSVIASEGYAWTAAKDANWITILAGEAGTGSGTLTYSVAANTGRDTRTGTITVDGKVFTVEQQGLYDNLALASRGSTIAGSNGGRWDLLIDGMTTGYNKSGQGYGYTIWTGDPAAPGCFELDVKELCRVDRVRVLLWDLDARYYQYRVESSADGVNWTVLADRTAGQWQGWQDISLPSEVEARYFRLTGTFNSMNSGFHVVEWEVYGYPAPVVDELIFGDPSPAPTLVRRTARGSSSDPRPVDVVVSSGEAPRTNGWSVVDGDLETAWSGRAGDDGWWLALVYDPPRQVSDVELLLDAASTTNVMILGSADALDWFELPAALEEGPVWIRYMWMVFGTNSEGRLPVVLEVRPIP